MCSLFLHCGKSKNQKYRNEKTAANPLLRIICGHNKMRLIGIEPTHAAPEATALSTELQTHLHYDTIFLQKLQDLILFFLPVSLNRESIRNTARAIAPAICRVSVK